MHNTISKTVLFLLTMFFFVEGYAQKEVVVIENEPVHQDALKERVIKRKVAIGRFSNETQYSKGLFYDKENDPMGKQAADILSAKLAASGKFLLLERTDLDKVVKELSLGDVTPKQIGADYLIIGSLTEFGRKNKGRSTMFSSTKKQIVQAAVSIRLVDVSTGLIIYSDEAKGMAESTSKTTLGVGGRTGYDATLSDKAISSAISQLVDNIINKCTNKPWRSYFLSIDDSTLVISGGASQDLRVGDEYAVLLRGKQIKNPQNGLMIELPGKQIGKIRITLTGGDTPEMEYSIVEMVEGSLDATQLSNYVIEEIK